MNGTTGAPKTWTSLDEQDALARQIGRHLTGRDDNLSLSCGRAVIIDRLIRDAQWLPEAKDALAQALADLARDYP